MFRFQITLCGCLVFAAFVYLLILLLGLVGGFICCLFTVDLLYLWFSLVSFVAWVCLFWLFGYLVVVLDSRYCFVGLRLCFVLFDLLCGFGVGCVLISACTV